LRLKIYMIDLILSELLNGNISLFYLINGINNPILNLVMPIITNFGSLIAWILICIFIYIFGGSFGRKVAVLCLIALFLTDIIVISLKYLVAEPRPFLTLPNVNLLLTVNGNSFPSGHTASSFTAATIIGLKYHLKSKGWNCWLIYPLIAFAILVGFSRIYIGVHYPYDVIFGAIIGTICAIIVFKYEYRILYNKIAIRLGMEKILTFNLIKKL
jgi:undecaprenyl-diphosphatase